MDAQDLIDALAGSGMDDDRYLAVAFAIRAMARRVELADDAVASVVAASHYLPVGAARDAFEYAATYLVDVIPTHAAA